MKVKDLEAVATAFLRQRGFRADGRRPSEVSLEVRLVFQPPPGRSVRAYTVKVAPRRK